MATQHDIPPGEKFYRLRFGAVVKPSRFFA